MRYRRRCVTGKLTGVVASLLLLLLSGSVQAKKKPSHASRGPYGASSRVVRAAEVHGQATLRVRSIDFLHRVVVIELGGFPKAPAGNLFTFTDDRGRRFIATHARCDEPFPSGARVCDLETPEGYERHPWVGLDLHLHGLQSNSVVAAPREEVERAFEAARALAEGTPALDETLKPEKPATPATSTKPATPATPAPPATPATPTTIEGAAPDQEEDGPTKE